MNEIRGPVERPFQVVPEIGNCRLCLEMTEATGMIFHTVPGIAMSLSPDGRGLEGRGIGAAGVAETTMALDARRNHSHRARIPNEDHSDRVSDRVEHLLHNSTFRINCKDD